jgi:hypothetical protein
VVLSFLEITGALGTKELSIGVKDKEVGITVDLRIARQKILILVILTDVDLDRNIVLVDEFSKRRVGLEEGIESMAPIFL